MFFVAKSLFEVHSKRYSTQMKALIYGFGTIYVCFILVTFKTDQKKIPLKNKDKNLQNSNGRTKEQTDKQTKRDRKVEGIKKNRTTVGGQQYTGKI